MSSSALAETAGSDVLDALIQRRDKPDPGTYLGKGKANELAEIVASVGADTVIIDSELAPSQRRGLEDVIKVKVVDRVALILDIFAQHAKSREGKAQVELAQRHPAAPARFGRVAVPAGRRSWSLAVPESAPADPVRRRSNSTAAASAPACPKLRREIAAMAPSRETKRKNRARHHVPSAAIVGYTNAGKSSLLNRLTDAEVMVQNALFATLDPTVRQAKTADGIVFTYTDTVGFVRNLPHQLVEAFRSTLEEAAGSDLLLHVVDASHPDPHGQIHAVREVLKDVETGDIPELLVFNKSDLAEEAVITGLRAEYPKAQFVSAVTREGIDGSSSRPSRVGFPPRTST